MIPPRWVVRFEEIRQVFDFWFQAKEFLLSELFHLWYDTDDNEVYLAWHAILDWHEPKYDDLSENDWLVATVNGTRYFMIRHDRGVEYEDRVIGESNG